MSDNILFYIVFAIQILLISYYFPRRMVNRMRYILTNYPPSEYPKLYPRSTDYYEKAIRKYGNINTGILLVGVLLLAGMALFAQDGIWEVVFPYFILQFVPVIMLEVGTVNTYKLMRRASTTRKAQLQPKRLLDFISPGLIGMAALVYIAFIVFIIYMNQFDYPWFGGYGNIAGVTAMNAFMAGMLLMKIYGKKQDPHQDHEDRKRETQHLAKQVAYVSIAATVHIALTIVLASMDLRDYELVSSSLYFQLIALIGLRGLRIENINFDVYKAAPDEDVNYRPDEEPEVTEKSTVVYKTTGLAFGMAFAVALGISEGATVKGLLLLGMVGGGIGLFLGFALSLWVMHLRNGHSTMV